MQAGTYIHVHIDTDTYTHRETHTDTYGYRHRHTVYTQCYIKRSTTWYFPHLLTILPLISAPE